MMVEERRPFTAMSKAGLIRQQRLLQVRQQEKRVAKAMVGLYRQRLQTSKEQVARELQARWEEQRWDADKEGSD
jgi:hypothetical protein